MSSKCRRGCVAVMVILLFVCMATPPVAAGMTLTDAVRQALEDNHQLKAANHAEESAKWAHRQAIAQLLPSISLQSSYTRLDDETVQRANAFGREITMFFPDSTGELRPFTIEIPQTVFRDGYETSINGQLLLFNPALWNGVSLANASRNLAAWQVEAAARETIHQTLTSFMEMLRLSSLTQLQEQYVEQAQDNLALAERLLGVGRYAEADVLRWKVEEARQSGLLYQQQNATKVAALSLENLIGEPPLGKITVDSELPARLEREIEQFRTMSDTGWEQFMQDSLELIIAGNPEQRILDLTERLAELEHRQSLAAFLPSVTIAGGYGWQNNDTWELDGDKAWSLTAALSIPIFTSLSNYSGRQVTKGKLLQTRETIIDGRRGLILAAEAARSDIRNSAAQLRLAEASLASARRNHEMMKNRFTLGHLSNLEWIDANLTLQNAEQTLTSAYYDLVIAIANYYQAKGQIDILLVDELHDLEKSDGGLR